MTLIPLAVAAALALQATAAPKTPAQKPGGAAKPAAAAAAKPAAGTLPVTLNYKGKGVVDDKHKLIVWMFADPNVTSSSRPVGTQMTTKNGGKVMFTNAPATPVYLLAVYDETGTYDGVSGPPPPGLPYALYKKAPKGPPTPVTAGTDAVTFTFSDAERWNK
jgi:hypothetical protein